MDWRERITSDPKVLAGKPVVRGTRVSVEQVIELLAQGWPETDILAAFPRLTTEDIRACLAYAGAVLRMEDLLPLPA